MNRHGSRHVSETPWPVTGYTVARCPDCDRPRRAVGDFANRRGPYRYYACSTPVCSEEAGGQGGIADVDLVLDHDETWDEWDGVLVILSHASPSDDR